MNDKPVAYIQRYWTAFDPSPQNPRSIRCLEKAGFQRVGEIITPDGPAVLMEIYKSNFLKS